MARRGFSQNLPNFIKGSSVVGACTIQGQAARAFHDDDEEAVAGGAIAGHDPSLVAVGQQEREGGGLKGVSPGRLHNRGGTISPKEVEEASRILFAPVHNKHAPARSVEGSYEDLGGGGNDDVDAEEAATPVPPPMFRGGSRGRAVGGLSSLASPTPRQPQAQSLAAAATTRSRPASPQPSSSATGPAASSSSLVGPLHSKPAVHAEILRFGMALAANPRIQSVIREELELRGQSDLAMEDGEEGQEEEAVGGMESAVRRLCGGLGAALEGSASDGDEEAEAEAWAAAAAAGGSSSFTSSFLTASYELVGLMGGRSEEAAGGGGGGGGGPEPTGASFLNLGRSIRRRDCVTGVGPEVAGAPEVSEEVLDELLRSDDEDDAITQKMFASTPDEQVRRYLRNLDLECVICHEYMVEATAVDCGEGHCFCRECIGRWLEEAEERDTKRCPTCQKRVEGCIPMRQYDAMIEKYVRASNLWDEITSYYRRKTLARMRRELEQEEAEREAEARRRREQGPGARASAAFMNAFAGLGSLFGAGREAGAEPGTGVRRRRQRGRGAGASSSSASGNATASATEGGQQDGHDGGREDRWWKSEVLQTALSVATMLILVVLFRRGVKIR